MMNVACVISGAGSFVTAIERGREESRFSMFRIALVIADRPGILGLKAASDAGIPERDIITIAKADFPDVDAWDEALCHACEARAIDILGLYGCRSLMPRNLVERYKGYSVNAHPGPLDPGRPDFGGKGMEGKAVHHAVMDFYPRVRGGYRAEPYRDRKGRTVKQKFTTLVMAQQVARQYDQGQIIGEDVVHWSAMDSVQSLQARALRIEHELHLRVLSAFAGGRVRDLPRIRPLIVSAEVPILEACKCRAIAAYK